VSTVATTHVLAVKVCALQAWLDLALPLYTRTPQDAHLWLRIRVHAAVTVWFNRPGGEARSFDLLPALAPVLCPTLVLGGTHGPMLPIECQRDIAAALPPHLVRHREFGSCAHGVVQDTGDEALALLREFILSPAGA
jgi:proline iminopeptidase